MGIGDLTVYSDPKDDPYLDPSQEDEDQEDKDDFNIRFVFSITGIFVQMFSLFNNWILYVLFLLHPVTFLSWLGLVSADQLLYRTVQKQARFRVYCSLPLCPSFKSFSLVKSNVV